MNNKLHKYEIELEWKGNLGVGTQDYKSYAREFNVSGVADKKIFGSADPAFRGKENYWNPEELLVASISACHQLWYLHLCADAGLCVISYTDNPTATMDGRLGKFVSIELKPVVTLSPNADAELAKDLHTLAHEKCYIAKSLNFEVKIESSIQFSKIV